MYIKLNYSGSTSELESGSGSESASSSYIIKNENIIINNNIIDNNIIDDNITDDGLYFYYEYDYNQRQKNMRIVFFVVFTVILLICCCACCAKDIYNTYCYIYYNIHNSSCINCKKIKKIMCINCKKIKKIMCKNKILPNTTRLSNTIKTLNEIDNCAICLTINNKKSIKLRCNHIFHNACIKEWNNVSINENTKTSCPLCRTLI